MQFSPGTSFYGTGEVGGQLERTGKRVSHLLYIRLYTFVLPINLVDMNCFQVFTWNSDAWGYGAGTTSLYQSHPWVLAVLPTGETLGLLADTTRKCEVYECHIWCHLSSVDSLCNVTCLFHCITYFSCP